MSVIDDYLQGAPDPDKRAELERIRALAKKHVPEAEEVISYAMPTLTYQGRPFLGFLAHKSHIGLYPFSGEVVETMAPELTEFELSKGTIRVPLDRPIDEALLDRVIDCRLALIRAAAPRQRGNRTGKR